MQREKRRIDKDSAKISDSGSQVANRLVGRLVVRVRVRRRFLQQNVLLQSEMRRNGNRFSSIFLLFAFLLLMGYYCRWNPFCSIEASTVVASLLLLASLLFLTFMLLLAFLLMLGFCCCWHPYVRKQKTIVRILAIFLIFWLYFVFPSSVPLHFATFHCRCASDFGFLSA
jgi:hypothetical protein